MAKKPTRKTEDQHAAPVVAEVAPVVQSSDLKVGDKVVILKDSAAAVVTQAFSVEGKRQTRVECQREDNDSVYTYWVDEVRRG